MKKVSGIILISFLLICLSFNVKGQVVEGITLKGAIVDGDTIAYICLPVVRIYAPRIFKSDKEERKWSKLVRDVKKVYPYAVLANEKIKDYDAKLIKIDSESEKKRMMKIAEDDLKKQFEGDIRNMTYSQGKILIKLIDRETGNTSYQIVKEFRGVLSAFFWQSVARLFGANLKDEYDAAGDDKLIEEIVLLIQGGDI